MTHSLVPTQRFRNGFPVQPHNEETKLFEDVRVASFVVQCVLNHFKGLERNRVEIRIRVGKCGIGHVSLLSRADSMNNVCSIPTELESATFSCIINHKNSQE